MKVQAPLARWVAEPPPPEVCAALDGCGGSPTSSGSP